MVAKREKKKRNREKNEVAIKGFIQRVCSPTTTSKRLNAISKFLEDQDKEQVHFSRSEWMYIWKGLFYSVWYTEMGKGCEEMIAVIARGCAARAKASPKAPEQEGEEGSQETGEKALGEKATGAYNLLTSGFETLAKEWFGLDSFRMDKFAYFVRQLTRAAIRAEVFGFQAKRAAKSEGKKPAKIQVVAKILASIKGTLGLMYHFCDVFVPELFTIMSEFRWTPEDKSSLINGLMKPFIRVLAETEDTRTFDSVTGSVFAETLREIRRKESLYTKQLFLTELTRNLMKSGSATEVKKRNRAVIYGLVGTLKGKLNEVDGELESATAAIASKIPRKRPLDDNDCFVNLRVDKKGKLEPETKHRFVRSLVPLPIC